MTDAQTWTLIGGFFALMTAMIALTLRTVRAEFATVHVKIDHLDRDVQALTDRLMRGRE